MTTSFQTTSEAGFRERFRRLSAEWKEQSRYLSNTAQMAMLKPYQRIVGMGLSAVPLILEELRREPDQWFWALEAITEENPRPAPSSGQGPRDGPGVDRLGETERTPRSMITREDFPRVPEENQIILRVLPKMFNDQDMHEFM
ncbi:MAG: hypothetical protein ACXVB2_25695 [Isosphaeraceae bacterium]